VHGLGQLVWILHLDKVTLSIKAGTNTNSRILPLETKQILFLDRYLNLERPKFIKHWIYLGNRLLIGKLGSHITNDQIHYLVESQRSEFLERKLNPKRC